MTEIVLRPRDRATYYEVRMQNRLLGEVNGIKQVPLAWPVKWICEWWAMPEGETGPGRPALSPRQAAWILLAAADAATGVRRAAPEWWLGDLTEEQIDAATDVAWVHRQAQSMLDRRSPPERVEAFRERNLAQPLAAAAALGVTDAQCAEMEIISTPWRNHWEVCLGRNSDPGEALDDFLASVVNRLGPDRAQRKDIHLLVPDPE